MFVRSINFKKTISLFILVGLAFCLLLSSSGCELVKKDGKNVLNPDKPITINIWHHYNGNNKRVFDDLISDFNQSFGMEIGIVVESESFGDLSQLDEAIINAATNSIGSAPIPDIFISHPDNIYGLGQMAGIIALDSFFSKEELASYQADFLAEGRLYSDNKLYALALAVSTDNLFVNKTDWDVFAAANGFGENDWASWQGILKMAESYYNLTGEAFFGVEKNSNFALALSQQLDEKLFSVNRYGKTVFKLSEETAQSIWNLYYVPYIKGYYTNIGRFSSDDAKTGGIIAYVSPNSRAGYFPIQVTRDNMEEYAVDPLVLPYPVCANNDRVAIQDFTMASVSKSDEAHQYASVVFLKWLTELNRNIDFALDTGYLPVTNPAYSEELLLISLATSIHELNPATKKSLIATNEMLSTYKFYRGQTSKHSGEIKRLLAALINNKIDNDLALLADLESHNENRDQIVNSLTSHDNFLTWYNQPLEEIDKVLED